MIDNQTNLSEHLVLGEFTKSRHADVYNVPTHEAVENLTRLCGWLEALRERYNAKYGSGNDPIRINSGYRSPQLNRRVGGAAGSNHLTGCAADIRVLGTEQLLRYATLILDYADETHQDFDELLLERNAHGAIWLHLAVRPFANRRKVRLLNA